MSISLKDTSQTPKITFFVLSTNDKVREVPLKRPLEQNARRADGWALDYVVRFKLPSNLTYQDCHKDMLEYGMIQRNRFNFFY
jgi:hypothetical protein